MLSGAREAGCFREVTALHSDHLRQVPLYHFHYVDAVRLDDDNISLCRCNVQTPSPNTITEAKQNLIPLAKNVMNVR